VLWPISPEITYTALAGLNSSVFIPSIYASVLPQHHGGMRHGVRARDFSYLHGARADCCCTVLLVETVIRISIDSRVRTNKINKTIEYYAPEDEWCVWDDGNKKVSECVNPALVPLVKAEL